MVHPKRRLHCIKLLADGLPYFRLIPNAMRHPGPIRPRTPASNILNAHLCIIPWKIYRQTFRKEVKVYHTCARTGFLRHIYLRIWIWAEIKIWPWAGLVPNGFWCRWIKSSEWSTMISSTMTEGENGDQNMAVNRPYIAPFLTSLPPIDNPESQLSIGAKLIKNGAI